MLSLLFQKLAFNCSRATNASSKASVRFRKLVLLAPHTRDARARNVGLGAMGLSWGEWHRPGWFSASVKKLDMLRKCLLSYLGELGE